jgi:voltage-gated potassium channel
MYYKIKKAVYDTIVNEESKTLAHRIFYIFIITLILLNIVLVAISTIDSRSVNYFKFIIGFDVSIIFIFTVEYILRIWSCNIDNRFKGRFGRIRYAKQPVIIIDLLAILPFYIVYFTPLDNSFAMIGRLLRLARILRFGFFANALKLMSTAIRRKGRELLITIIIVVILVIFCAYIIYYAENRAQPEIYSSIPKSIYWAFVTLSTVGYGDMTPVTPFGRFFTAFVAFLGVGIIAIPAGIISSGMTEVIRERKMAGLKKDREISGTKQKCPHCGKPIEDK